ncbi:sensor histidine kinase [Miniphocaeibacter halophilus]|uniref:HAMP domain-containing histidine kinase n=1 Tax=Miniphocaeibacter halophilus TaxID=2931922 RepID=A0AC61MWV3_9FIRM|nr:HAMP domain-containing sensor histidine kinase [Miniphocaeibacter halophilus]QQK08043.1 HAMP domain-containing histidine kinase [Miniphocaeibacter halophilus]
MKIYLLIILVGLLTILLMYLYFKKRENQLIDNLQNMIELAEKDNYSFVKFDESKLSVLENSMKHYLIGNRIKLNSILKQKESYETLISDISHQSITPISNIILYSELLQENHKLEEIDAIKNQVEKLHFLIESLISLSRLETGIITINPKKENIKFLLQKLENQFKPKILEKGINFELENKSIYAKFDFKWTEEAIGNIVENAIKYTDYGGKITISIEEYQFFARIDIKDTGIGIKEKELNKIFKRFFRSNDVNGTEGVGLGLYLTRKIINMEGGYLKVESKKSVGTNFSVFLPI